MKYQKGQSGNIKGRKPIKGVKMETIGMLVVPGVADRLKRLGYVTGKPYTRILGDYVESHIERIEDELIMESIR